MLPGQSAGERFKFYGFYKRQRLWDAPLGQRKGGVFRLPPPFLWTPPTPQRIKGCSPLIIPKEKSKRKNASRFAQMGCGAQRPLRALSGTRVLLTAAPTAPPCIRRWRRSSPLHFFLASPIDRPLSRCGGSSPQGSQRLQLPFAVTTPSREKENLKNPQIFQILKIKIIFPLKMPRVKRRAFQIVRRLKGSPCKTKPFP